jgi:hypothetical protein
VSRAALRQTGAGQLADGYSQAFAAIAWAPIPRTVTARTNDEPARIDGRGSAGTWPSASGRQAKSASSPSGDAGFVTHGGGPATPSVLRGNPVSLGHHWSMNVPDVESRTGLSFGIDNNFVTDDSAEAEDYVRSTTPARSICA